eukprot:CAMPEP_0174231798 /NCGR_PEP_ID=MMETSP0417-20130205/2239_1 /TAXON_ID=242541 /ORGANISM="Mayorella sp, Strain BSH-02190019" /LENGTH=548 /DNA_ID=CAMNT_0015309749 /DNA_START=89 /DNA_END=1735 /DNA_ORIENTATION=-
MAAQYQETLHRMDATNADHLRRREGTDFLVDNNGYVYCRGTGGVSLSSFTPSEERPRHGRYPSLRRKHCFVLNAAQLEPLHLKVVGGDAHNRSARGHGFQNHFSLQPTANLTVEQFVANVTDQNLWELCAMMAVGEFKSFKDWYGAPPGCHRAGCRVRELSFALYGMADFVEDAHDLLAIADLLDELDTMISLEQVPVVHIPLALRVCKLYFDMCNSDEEAVWKSADNLGIEPMILLDAVDDLEDVLALPEYAGCHTLESAQLRAYLTYGNDEQEVQPADASTLKNLFHVPLDKYNTLSADARKQLLLEPHVRPPKYPAMAEVCMSYKAVAETASLLLTFDDVPVVLSTRAIEELATPEVTRALCLWSIDQRNEEDRADSAPTALEPSLVGATIVNPIAHPSTKFRKMNDVDATVCFTWFRICPELTFHRSKRVSHDLGKWLRTLREHWPESFSFKFIYVSRPEGLNLNEVWCKSVGPQHDKEMARYGFTRENLKILPPPKRDCTHFCLLSWDRPHQHSLAAHEAILFLQRQEGECTILGKKLLQIPI